MIIVRLLSPEPVGWFRHLQLYLGCGSRHCHGINSVSLTLQAVQESGINRTLTNEKSGTAESVGYKARMQRVCRTLTRQFVTFTFVYCEDHSTKRQLLGVRSLGGSGGISTGRGRVPDGNLLLLAVSLRVQPPSRKGVFPSPGKL